jgi:hypothetical protein
MWRIMWTNTGCAPFGKSNVVHSLCYDGRASWVPRQRCARGADDIGGYRLAAIRIEDVDRREAERVIRIEQREAAGAMDDVASVDDIGCNRLPRVAIHPSIDQGIGQMDRVAQLPRVLQARQGRLGTQIAARVRQVPYGPT